MYDRVNKWGGAERVLLALHKLFPDAPLFTSVYDREKAAWAKVFDIKTSFLQKFPFATNHELYATLMPIAFETFSFDEYDLVISITSESGKGIVTKPKTKHICYCLTPTRYLWSGYEEYFKNPYSFYQNHTRADIGLAAKRIGFQAKWQVETGIRDYLTQIYSLEAKAPAQKIKNQKKRAAVKA